MAGAPPPVALQAGLSMTALQFSIGALNDLHDAPGDAGRKPGKPIPAGLVGRSAARVAVATTAALGVALAGSIDVRIGWLALLVLVIGYWYDLLAKGTAWSWLPFAFGIPVLPAYGWLAAGGDLPAFFAALLPMAALAGSALAAANARADLERDLAAGDVSIATRLGLEGSWRLGAASWALVLALALGWLAFHGARPADTVPVLVAAVLMAAVVAWSRDRGPDGRERAWEMQAVGAALALLTWLGPALPRA